MWESEDYHLCKSKQGLQPLCKPRATHSEHRSKFRSFGEHKSENPFEMSIGFRAALICQGLQYGHAARDDFATCLSVGRCQRTVECVPRDERSPQRDSTFGFQIPRCSSADHGSEGISCHTLYFVICLPWNFGSAICDESG